MQYFQNIFFFCYSDVNIIIIILWFIYLLKNFQKKKICEFESNKLLYEQSDTWNIYIYIYIYSADPRLMGALRKTGGGGGGVVKRICPCFTPSRIALTESARETLSSAARTLSTVFF